MPPLSLSLNKTDTSMPLLMAGKYPVAIKKIEAKESNNKPGNWMLNVQLQTVKEEKDNKGAPLKEGFSIFTTLCLPPWEDGQWDESFKKKIALFMLAALGYQNTPENVAQLPADLDDAFLSDLPGKQLMVSVQVKPADAKNPFPYNAVSAFFAIE